MYTFSEITISYKPLRPHYEMPEVHCSSSAYDILREHWSDKIQYKEEFYILLLNTRNMVLGISKISEGGTNSTVLDPKIVFQTALKANASAIILAHNHPSGRPMPSESDIKMTKRLKELGLMLDLRIHDHIICCNDCYYSFAEECLL